MMNKQALDRLWEIVDEHSLYASSRNLRFYMDCAFDGVTFTGKKVLDVGAGLGLCSFYAACMGAEKVISLEPEADGATTGVRSDFEKIKDMLGANQITIFPTTVQNFDPQGEKFDVIILDDCINHLDEDACTKLHKNDKQAKDSYIKIFNKIASVSAPGSKIVITDCSRYNIFPLLGLKNPLCPTIEWHKHQSPECWAKLLTKTGFKNPWIRWRSLNRFGSTGRLIFGNKAVAFFLLSRFFLTMEKP